VADTLLILRGRPSQRKAVVGKEKARAALAPKEGRGPVGLFWCCSSAVGR